MIVMLEFCNLVWCGGLGMVWSRGGGMAWYGIVCYVMRCYAMWYGMVWYDRLCCGTVCYTVARCVMWDFEEEVARSAAACSTFSSTLTSHDGLAYR